MTALRTALGSVALGVATLTLTSRILGFGRSLVFSKTVGDTCLGDVYNAANTLPNVLFEIVAGGVLAGVVVPVVARHVGAARTAEASRTVSALLTWTLLVLTVPAVAALLGASRYAAAFSKPACAGGAEVLAGLLVWFVPQIWLYGLAVVSAGVLQAHSRFLAAAAAPLFSSVVVIAAYLGYAATASRAAAVDLTVLPERAITVLGLGTTLGVLALALTTTLALGRCGLRLRPALRFAPGDRSVIVRIAGAGVAGLVVQQLSLLAITFVAQRYGEPGALTRFGWANAIYLLPYAVLAAPLLQLIFPRLSAAAEQDPDRASDILVAIGAPITILSCLGAALLVATAVPVARVFVLGPGSGRTEALAWPLVAFAPAVVGFALLGLASRALLAEHRARSAGVATVVAWTVVAVGVLGSGAMLPPRWLVVGLAAAVSLGMVAGAVVGWRAVLDAGTTGRGTAGAVLGRPLLVGVPAGIGAAVLPAWATAPLADAGLGAAALGAVAAATAGTVLFLGVVVVLDRSQAARLQVLWRRAGTGASG